MSIAPDLELIEHLDWEHTPECEHPQHATLPQFHGGPAYVLVSYSHECGRSRVCYICEPHWRLVVVAGAHVRCAGCQARVLAPSVYTALGWVE